MAVYTVDMRGGGAGDQWADAASALAKAFTPDYAGMGEMALRAEQANTQRAQQGLYGAQTRAQDAAAALDEDKLAAMSEFTSVIGDLPAEEQAQLLFEFAPRMGLSGADVDNYLSSFANADLSMPFADVERFRGTEYGDTAAGEHNILTHEGQNAIDLERAKPIITDGAIIGGAGDPRFSQYPGGVAPFGNEITGGNTIFQPQFDADGNYTGSEAYTAPRQMGAGEIGKIRKFNDGYFEVTQELQADGTWKEIARGPRTTAGGEGVVEDPYDQIDEDYVLGAYGTAVNAPANMARYEMMQTLLEAAPETGPITELTMPMRQAAAQLFPDLRDDAAILEALNVEFGKDIMSHIQDTKGAVSDREMAFFTRISNNLGNTKRGNMLILELKRRAAIRLQGLDAEIGKMREQGLTNRQMRQRIDEYYDQNPIIDAELESEFGLTPDAEPEGGWNINTPFGTWTVFGD